MSKKMSQMLNNLPDPDRSILAHPPLQQVSLIVGWQQETNFPSEAGVHFLATLKEHPLLREAQLVPSTLTLVSGTVGQPNQVQQVRGWQVSQSQFSASIYAESVVVEDREYAGWDAFIKRSKPAIVAAANLSSAKVSTRVVLRYTNILSNPDALTVAFWRGKVKSEYLGVADDDALARPLSAQMGFYNFKEASLEVQLRTGILPTADAKWAFTIDIEATDRSIAEFRLETIFEIAAAQNTVCLKIFQALLDPEYFNTLRGKVKKGRR